MLRLGGVGLLSVLLFSVSCGDSESAPPELGDSWIRASGTYSGQPFSFAEHALVVAVLGKHLASAANQDGVGFSISLDLSTATPNSDCTSCLGLTHRTREGKSSAFTPVPGGTLRVLSLGATGEPVSGELSLAWERPADQTYDLINIDVTGSFSFLRQK